MPSRHAARVRSMAGIPMTSPSSSRCGVAHDLGQRYEALIGLILSGHHVEEVRPCGGG